MKGAVFLDRDGVLNEVVWRDGQAVSPRTLADFTIVPDIAAVARLRAAGLRLFVVTNQPDIARGRLESAVLDQMLAALQAHGFDEVASCRHDDEDDCACRKPRPGMLHALAERWGVDLSASYMVGDSWRDVEAGRAAGCRTVIIRRDYNGNAAADIEAADLTGAVDAVLADRKSRSMSFSRQFLAEATAILDRLDAGAIDALADRLAALRERGGRLFFCGVGGGAAHASHATADFRKIAQIESYSVTDNVAELTARTNDEGWATSFAEYLRASRFSEKDALFVFSVGGGDEERGVSINIVRAVGYARTMGGEVYGVVGRDGGHTARVGDAVVIVPVVGAETITAHTEAFQAVVWHLLVAHPKLQRNAMKWESIASQQGDGMAPSGQNR
jgi:D-sedoheptulose 7-phosphate isomerase